MKTRTLWKVIVSGVLLTIGLVFMGFFINRMVDMDVDMFDDAIEIEEGKMEYWEEFIDECEELQAEAEYMERSYTYGSFFQQEYAKIVESYDEIIDDAWDGYYNAYEQIIEYEDFIDKLKVERVVFSTFGILFIGGAIVMFLLSKKKEETEENYF